MLIKISLQEATIGKPSAPAAPDYTAAAQAQGVANESAALGTNFLNQVNQSGPYGTLAYNYNYSNGLKLPDGTVIPSVSATTTLSPDQQKLLDQQTEMSTDLNNLGIQALGSVGDAIRNPMTASQFQPLQTQLSDTGDPTQADALRDKITNAYMARLQPSLDQQQSALDTRLANQGINIGSNAWNQAQFQNEQGVNDQRTAALLAGDQAQQNDFNNGLASSQFANQAQQQAIQEANYFQTQPLNLVNALRTGNQVTNPQFGNVSGGSQIGAAPVYQATQDQYSAAMQQYQAQMSSYNAMLGGLAGLGGTAMHLIPGFGG